MSTIDLQNVAHPPRPLDFHLPHEVVCAAVGACSCLRTKAGVSRVDPETRKRVSDPVNRRVPGTLSLMARGTAGSTLTGLHPAVLEAPEVKAALARRDVRVVVAPQAAAPAPKDPPASPPQADDPAQPKEPKVRKSGTSREGEV